MLPGLLICHCGLIMSLRADLSLFINGLEDKSMSLLRSKGSLEKILYTQLNVKMPLSLGTWLCIWLFKSSYLRVRSRLDDG